MEALKTIESAGSESGACSLSVIISDCGQLANVVVAPSESLSEIRDMIKTAFLSLTTGTSKVLPISLLSMLVSELGQPFSSKKEEDIAALSLNNSKGYIELPTFTKWWLTKIVEKKVKTGGNEMNSSTSLALSSSNNMLFTKTNKIDAVQEPKTKIRPISSSGKTETPNIIPRKK